MFLAAPTQKTSKKAPKHPPREPVSQTYAPELLHLLRNLLPPIPDDPLNPVLDKKAALNAQLDKLSPKALTKLKAQALDSLSTQLTTKNASVELQTICNRVMIDKINKKDVVWLKVFDRSGRRVEHRYLKVFKPTKLHSSLRRENFGHCRSITRKAKTMITVMELLSFDDSEQVEILQKFAKSNGLVTLVPAQEQKQRKKRKVAVPQKKIPPPSTAKAPLKAPPFAVSVQPPPFLATRPLHPSRDVPAAAAAAVSVPPESAAAGISTLPTSAPTATAVTSSSRTNRQPPPPPAAAALGLLAQMSTQSPP